MARPTYPFAPNTTTSFLFPLISSLACWLGKKLSGQDESASHSVLDIMLAGAEILTRRIDPASFATDRCSLLFLATFFFYSHETTDMTDMTFEAFVTFM